MLKSVISALGKKSSFFAALGALQLILFPAAALYGSVPVFILITAAAVPVNARIFVTDRNPMLRKYLSSLSFSMLLPALYRYLFLIVLISAPELIPGPGTACAALIAALSLLSAALAEAGAKFFIIQSDSVPLKNFSVSSSPFFADIGRLRISAFAALHFDLIFLVYALIAPGGSSTLMFTASAALPLFSLIASVLLILRLFKKAASFKGKLMREISECAFEAVCYFGGGARAVYQLNQWTGVLEKSDKRILIIIRELEPEALNEARGYCSRLDTVLKIIYLRTMKNIEEFLPRETRIVFYVGHSMQNSQMMRVLRPLQHVFLNHGESDKNVNVYPLLLSYGKLWVAGQMAIDRIKKARLDIAPHRFAVIGRPQLENTVKPEKGGNKIKTILYAPTWEGMQKESDYSSVASMSLAICTALTGSGRFRLIFKPHPFTGMRTPSLNAVLAKIETLLKGPAHLYSADGRLYDFFNESDLLITDISAVMNDYLESMKPFIVCNIRNIKKELLNEEFPTTGGGYILNPDFSNIGGFIESIENSDRLARKRKKIKEYSLGSFPDGIMNNFNDEVNKLYAEMIKKYPLSQK